MREVTAKSMLTKRIPVREETWATLSRLKEPGETFDELLTKIVDLEAGRRLACELQAIRERGDYEDLE
jgi:predicted CopG family antitoxin